MGHIETVETPLNQSWSPKLWREREKVGLPAPGSVLTSPLTFPCPHLPRQALSLLFDTYHNEVDAFLLADVSIGPGAGPAARAPPLLPQSSWDQAALQGSGIDSEDLSGELFFHFPTSGANLGCWLLGSGRVCGEGSAPLYK